MAGGEEEDSAAIGKELGAEVEQADRETKPQRKPTQEQLPTGP
jgi:hypothetical protein